MTDLTERYVGATLRSIPERQRADIEAELRASIDDAIEAKIGSGQDRDLAERQTLSELGDPDRLAAEYTGRPGYLIGPEHFFDYRRLLTILLISVVPIVAVVIAVVQVIAGDDMAEVFGSVFSVVLSLIVHIVFWTTLVFALIERSGDTRTGTEWSLAHLPPVPTRGTVKLGETIASVVLLVFVIAGISLSGTFSPAPGTPIFDPGITSFWLPFFVVVLGLEVIFEVVKYRVGRWTWTLASVNLALNALFAIPAIYLLTTQQLFNPDFFEQMGWGGEPAAGGAIVVVTVISIAGIALWDIVDGFRKAMKVG